MNEAKIPVYVTITRFTGLGRHVHVEMREEAEPHSDGKLRVMSFINRDRALEWVRHTFAQTFDSATHELVFAEPKTRKWFYPEGD
ncbi:MAG: hypothetical protein EA428_07300 [Spirochaetaceae bacterium]|nr:MAG: hypothetical protein EA428_07300 [Spirochaetaceae bacterium]